jgi:hypothetical protein
MFARKESFWYLWRTSTREHAESSSFPDEGHAVKEGNADLMGSESLQFYSQSLVFISEEINFFVLSNLGKVEATID